MEAFLLTVEFGLMVLLVYTIFKRDRGDPKSRNLGFFHYKEYKPRETDTPQKPGTGAGGHA